ncbi:MAG: DNA translocase FtsK [Ruminococcaceae bacterium]|nr:DNA translocase FtsK [Oscillospiraceae bacterium]
MLWPVLLIYVAVVTAMEKPHNTVSGKVWLSTVIILLTCAAVYIFSNKELYDFESFGKFTVSLYENGMNGISAGLAGGYVGHPIILATGEDGARILIVIVLCVLIMVLTGITLKHLYKAVTKPVKAVSKGIRDVRERRAEERKIIEENRKIDFDVPDYLPAHPVTKESLKAESGIPENSEPPKKAKNKNEKLDNLNRVFGIETGEKDTTQKNTDENVNVSFDDLIPLQNMPKKKPAVKNPVNENTGEVKTEITDLPETPDIPEPEIIEENPIEKIDTVPVKDKEETAYLPYQKLEPARKSAENTAINRKEPEKIRSDVSLPVTTSEDVLENAAKAAEDYMKKKEEAAKIEMANSAQMALYVNNKDKENTYVFPPVSLLESGKKLSAAVETEELQTNGRKLVDTLKSFGVQTSIVDISRGPSVTRYELQPAPGVKISKITGLADDIALNLAAAGVRIEAPIPGKAAVGIEIPNKNKTIVKMRELIESNAFVTAKSKLTMALGRDIGGQVQMADLGKMPHMLIAGTTGSGKSVCINSIIISLIYKSSPDDVRFLMIDPKVVELGVYNGIPHLLVPVVTDPRKAAGALNWAVTEMLNRYKIFADFNVKDLQGYNHLAELNGYQDENGQPMIKMPRIVIIIDELADLMMAAPNEVEDSICRLAQMARAAGMHLLVATQRPTVDVVTGLIKANIPSRIAFAVSSAIDSRTILDSTGAEKLLGQGDMLFSPVGVQKPTRIQGCYVSESEIEAITDFVKKVRSVDYDAKIVEDIENRAVHDKSKNDDVSDSEAMDPVMEEAIKLVIDAGEASVSLIQRRLRVGYARAGRLIDQMEQMGIIGPHAGSKSRQVLMTYNQWLERNMNKPDNVNEEDNS